MTTHHTDYEKAANNIIARVGKKIVIGVPLGIGKPIGILNALYRIIEKDPSLQLTIITGLTLARPTLRNDLEKAFITPILDRLLKNYEDPLYEKARELQNLPKNINVIEFFLSPGKYLHNNYVQQNYISSAYTNVVRDAARRSINVIGQQVAHSKTNKEHYSLSCNTDLFHETVQYLAISCTEKNPIAIIGEVNQNLPFMLGDDVVVNAGMFTDVIDTGHYKTLFPLPREELAGQDHLLGFYTSCLIKDGGCLQIGIGKHSHSIASALIMRHKNNALYQDLFKQLRTKEKFSVGLEEQVPFKQGLYASTEMFSDEYMQLYLENILKKRVYDHTGLQKLLNERVITETITPDMLDQLVSHNIINSVLTPIDIQFLQKFGIVSNQIKVADSCFILPTGEKIPADLSIAYARQQIIAHCLGKKLQSGKILHAGFCLGSVDFYQKLNDLSPKELQNFYMTSVARTNSLNWSYELSVLQRQDASFVNYAMMVTLNGFVISDGIKGMQEISGVGGQFDFVYMAQQLPSARSIVNCRSTRQTRKKLLSNIVLEYPNMTLPRYLRDIVITEYGIADCRSKTDSEVIQTMLNIVDSRFQEELLLKAKKLGKVPGHYEIQKEFQNNFPEKIAPLMREMQSKGYWKGYPFGSDLSPDEIVLQGALTKLAQCSKLKLVMVFLCALCFRNNDRVYGRYLKRMQLDRPKTLKQFIYKRLLNYFLYLEL